MINMRLIVATLFVLFSHQFARADFVLHWSPPSQTSTGAPIRVDLFLDETGTSFINDFGISGASYQITLSGVGGLDVPVENINYDDMVDPTSNGTIATVVQTSILGVIGTMNTSKIGSFTINPTTTGTGSLSIQRLNPGFPGDFTVYTNSSFDQLVLDSTIIPAANFNFEFTAVPEPSSAVTLASLAALAILHRRVAASMKKRRQ